MSLSARAQLVRLGIFTIVGLVIFAVLIFMFRPTVEAIRGGKRVTIHLAYAGEVRSGTPVRYLGIDAGQVVEVRYAPPQVGGVEVVVLLRKDAMVRNDPAAPPYVDTKLTGEAYIEFPPASPTAPLLKEGDRIEGIYRKTVPDLVAELARLSRNLDATALEFKAAAADIRDEIDSVGASLRKLADRASALLEYPNPGDTTPRPNIATALQRFDRILAEAERIVGDKDLQRNIRTAVEGFRRTSERLSTTASEVEEVVAKLRSFADRGDTIARKLERRIDQVGAVVGRQDANLQRLLTSALTASERLSELLATANRVLERIEEGRGTLGRLASDPALFEELVRTAREARQAILAARVLFREFLDHPGDYFSVARRRTGEEKRRERVRKLLEETAQPNP